MLLHGMAWESSSHPVPLADRVSMSLPFLPPLPIPPLVKMSVGEEEGWHTLLPGHIRDPGRRYGESPGHRQKFNKMHSQRTRWEQQMHLLWTARQLASLRKLHDRQIMALLAIQGSTCKGSMHHACWGPEWGDLRGFTPLSFRQRRT